MFSGHKHRQTDKKERGSDRETERHTLRDRKIQRETHTYRGRDRNRKTDRKTQTHTQRERQKQKERHTQTERKREGEGGREVFKLAYTLVDFLKATSCILSFDYLTLYPLFSLTPCPHLNL
uniref:Uncharacterized protein n=1 Tax=Mus spicilegus TaxID=10103 RepID=A0A8C6N5R4_MUSSI